MHVIRDAWHEEEGTSLVIVTLTLIVLMGFAAIAIDLAHAWSQRRQDQSAVDTAGIAGALMTADQTVKAVAIADASAEVIRISKQSLDIQLTDAQWAAEWATCSDPDRPAIYTLVSPASPCISFTDKLEQMRVNIPTIDIETTFGKALGVSKISTGAAAEISIAFDPPGGAMPFGMPGQSAGDGEVCLKTGSNPSGVPPCDGPATGNFSFLDITQFGNIRYGTTKQCTGANSNRMARNIAQGIDHPIGWRNAAGPPHRRDVDMCNAEAFNSRPWTLATETGNMTGAVHQGMVDGIAGVPGKLTVSTNTVDINGDFIDNTPLWTYLNGNGQTLCPGVINHDQMIACLGTWTAADGVIWDDSIADAARFGWVPLFWEWTLGSGSTDLTLREFRPIFAQTTFWKCNNSGCNTIHDPGEPMGGTGGGGGNIQIEALTAIQIPFDSLPKKIRDVAPGRDGQTVYSILE